MEAPGDHHPHEDVSSISGEEADIDGRSDTDDASTSSREEDSDGSAHVNVNDSSDKQQLAKDLFDQYDPSRMQLTPEEHGWAVDIRNAIESIPDLDSLSHFWYGQLALVTKGNTSDAVDRAFRLQAQMKENNIMDTMEDGLRNLPKDAHFLSLDYNLHTGGYVVAMDLSKTDSSMFHDLEETRYYHRRSFYVSHMGFCDFAALRTGSTVLCDCEGYKLVKGKSMDLHAFRTIWTGVHAYPKNINQVKFFNSPPMFNVMVSVAKMALPKEVTANFQVGAKCPLGRLDKLFQLPTPEIAHARLQERLKSFIRKRYVNEMFFSLDQESGKPPMDAPGGDPPAVGLPAPDPPADAPNDNN